MKTTANKLWALFLGVFLSVPIVALAQDYFQASGIPVQRSAISSAEFRTEFANIETNISDKLPPYTGNGDNFVTINAGGTALTSLTPAAAATALGAPSLSGNETITGLWNFSTFDLLAGSGLSVQGTSTDQGQVGQIAFADVNGGVGRFGSYNWDTASFQPVQLVGSTVAIGGPLTISNGATVVGDVSATTIGGITESSLLDRTATETVSGSYTYTNASGLVSQHAAPRMKLLETGGVADEGNWWFVADAGRFDLRAYNDAESAYTQVFGINRTGQSPDSVAFNIPITATSYGGITQANLLDKSAAETITANLIIDVASGGPHLTVRGGSAGSTIARFERDVGANTFIELSGGSSEPQILFDRSAGTNQWYMGVDATDQFVIGDGSAVNINDEVIITAAGDVSATSFGGITESDLVDKSAAETIAGAWTLPVASITAHQASIDHDALTNFVANEHLRWDLDLGATNLHANNSANGSLALASGEVTQLANIGATTISAADWTATAALAGTNTGDEPAASTTASGIVERATQAEVDAGTDTTRYVTPATLEAKPGSSGGTSLFKTAATARTSTTALADDPHLAGWTLTAGEYYKLEGYLRVSVGASATPDFRFAWQQVNNMQQQFMTWQSVSQAGLLGADSGSLTSTFIPQIAAAETIGIVISGLVLAHATLDTTLDFQWAQGTSSGFDTTIEQGSWITFTQMP